MTRRWVVEPNVVGGWDVRPEDAAHVFRSSSRAEAEKEARRRARSARAEVVVLDGRGGVLDTFVPTPRSPRKAPGSRQAPPVASPVPAPPSPPEGRPAAAAGPPPVPEPAEPPDDPVRRLADAMAKGDGDLADRVAAAARGEVKHQADAVLGRGFKAWYAGADENQRLAAKVLIASALLGPVGAGILTVAKAVAHPTLTLEIATSLFWLVLLTAPVLVAAVVFVLVLGHANVPVTFGLAAIASIAAAWAAGKLGVPHQLADFYCFAGVTSDGPVYEHACRVMDTQGFVTGSAASFSVSKAPKILGDAFSLVSDARGGLLAWCGVAAGFSGGYLLRRASQT